MSATESAPDARSRQPRVQHAARAHHRRGRRLAGDRPRGYPLPGRRERQRQDDRGPDGGRSPGTDAGNRPLRGTRPAPDVERGAQGVPAGGATRPPGPLCLAQPGAHHRRHLARAAAPPQAGAGPARGDRAGGRAADPGRSHPAAELSQQVPASAQRRSAPAGGRGAGAGAQPAADHRRRGGLDGRRLDPGQHPQHHAQAARTSSASPSSSSRTIWRW